MATYVVAYDLNRETKRPPIVDEVKKTDWARLSESSYAISTFETSTQVYNRFKKHLDDNDNLYVITLSRPWYGWGPKDVIQWLTDKLGL